VTEEALDLRVVRLAHASDLPLPAPASEGSAGLDLRAAVEDDLVLEPGERARVPTGLVLEIPFGWEGQVRPRSGLAAAYGITLTNSPGTIDSDYRGEVQVLLVNHGDQPFTVHRGERIAQLVLAPVARVRVVEAERLDDTGRGDGGFGSTGRS
jgi:dUTP pyrophosphatase